MANLTSSSAKERFYYYRGELRKRKAKKKCVDIFIAIHRHCVSMCTPYLSTIRNPKTNKRYIYICSKRYEWIAIWPTKTVTFRCCAYIFRFVWYIRHMRCAKSFMLTEYKCVCMCSCLLVCLSVCDRQRAHKKVWSEISKKLHHFQFHFMKMEIFKSTFIP